MALQDISSVERGQSIYGLPELFEHSTPLDLHVYEVRYSGGDKSFWLRVILTWDLSPVAGLTPTGATIKRILKTLLGAGGHDVLMSRILDPETVIDPCWIDQDHAGSDAWDDEGGDFDHTGPPAGFTFQEATGLVHHVIDDPALLVLVQDALDNRDNQLMLLMYLSDEDPGINTGASWVSNVTLTLTFDDAVTPTAHRDIVVSRDRGRRPRAGRRVLAPRRPRSPRRTPS